MRKITIILLFILFILNKDNVAITSISAINLWSQKIFPILFPTFIISDALISSGIINDITKTLGKFFSKIFNVSEYGLYIFLISLLAGTPTNAKNLKILYDNDYISEYDITKILSFCIFFNPLLIIQLTGIKILFIMWIANIITGIFLRNVLNYDKLPFKKTNITFNLSESIEKNINLLLMILGTILTYMVITNILPITNPYIKVFIGGIFEVTNGLNNTSFLFKNSLSIEILAIIFISFGGISIHTQIKSILKDTKINYIYFFLSRLITAIIGIIICWCT